jgi:hypothetical protein
VRAATLLGVTAVALSAAGAIVLVRDPDAVALALLAICLGVAAAALGAQLALWLETRGMARGRRRPAARVGRAVRRGIAVGATVAILTLLRAVDGLTPLTAAFVALSFLVAEVVLSARASAVR